MRLYIAGKMTWVPQFNFPAFDAFKASLVRAGHDVVSPAELDSPEDRARAMASPDGAPIHYESGMTHADFLARDIKIICDDGIEGVVVLPGTDWQNSTGAAWETFVAYRRGLPIYQWDAAYQELRRVPRITLFRAWCTEPLLTIAHSWEAVPA